MRLTITIGLAAVAFTNNVSAGDPAEPVWHHVNIQVRAIWGVPAPLLWQSEDGATNIFAKSGVQLTWRFRSSRPDANECGSEPATRDIALEFVTEAPRNFTQNALAMTALSADSGSRIVIFYDRVTSVLRAHRSHQAIILSYVLAHEIMHVLQGISHHSEVGVMRARWTEDDFDQMIGWALRFSPEDVQLIPRPCGEIANSRRFED